MKKIFSYRKMLLMILIVITAFSSYAQQFTQTVTAQNRNCNSTCSVIDIPELNGNGYAVLFITQVPVNSINLDPHPIGAYYMYLNKWSVLNLDGVAIPVGAKFNIEYYTGSTGANSTFTYQVPSRPHAADPAYIDFSTLNNNPNLQVKVFPVGWFNNAGQSFNKEDVKVEYDVAAKKWFIANVNTTNVPSGASYNVAFSAPSLTVITTMNPTPVNGTTFLAGTQPAAGTSPNGVAGGDLSGTYPNPKVTGLQGKPLSNIAPTIGQILKWNGSAWEAANEVVPTVPPVAAKPSVLFFNQSTEVNMTNPNVNVATINGLDNQVFTLPQNSRIVFHTTIVPESVDAFKHTGTSVWLTVEILNSSNAVVANSSCDIFLGDQVLQSMNSTGLGVLPAGTYHTRVSINRQSGGPTLTVFNANSGFNWTVHYHQGGQMIIEVFPDQ